jgi:alginate O-acetyltransferase complex protein AlgI
VNTEIADINDKSAVSWVCYDADCPICRRWAGRFESMLNRNGFQLVPLQSPKVREFLKLPEKKLLEEMRVVTNRGIVFGGADAIVELAKAIPVLKPFYVFTRLPGIMPILRAVYRYIARNRICDNGACEMPVLPHPARLRNWIVGLPLLILTIAAVVGGHTFPGWAYMWLICLALFFGCKWLVFFRALATLPRPGVLKSLGFLFGWIGMDAKAFFGDSEKATKPKPAEWLFASSKILLGAALVWMVTREIYPANPLLAGWTGMFGLILSLHFGFFELLALAWRSAGVNVLPLMLAPIKARTLGEFWGRRWNTGFHKLASDFAFRPALQFFGVRGATLTVFALSGLLHDFVLSVPARGGYGLPTAYFLIQGAGVLFERTPFARRWIGGRGGRSWLFTMIVTAAPAFWLFHPPFVRNVMIPFLKTLNAV